MTTEIPTTGCSGGPPRQEPDFTMSFTATPRGARLARRLASHRLDAWGHPYGTRVNDTVTLVVAELAANAVRHGLVPGRDFRLRLVRRAGVVRVEVADARGDRLPPAAPVPPLEGAECGRGLWLVSRLAERWAVEPRRDGPGKTVWAEVVV
ncbi:ATP-binding protein [Streptomyces sp. NPDC059740]|uniref:ATP-binding protein n=1 Tax=Streptomyces sp. NPDC059740 TaxID=3346926 RepID=UPI00366565C0